MASAILPAAILALEGAAPPSAGSTLADHWELLAVIGIIIATVILVLSVLARYVRLAVNLFLDTPLPLTANLVDFTPPQGEPVTFPSREGRSLRGMFIERRPGTPDRGLVLFCHEFDSDMMSAGRYAAALVDAGYTVFTFDFRGHGGSFTPPHFEPRHWPSNHEVNDILAAVAFVKSQRLVGPEGIGVLGVSRGASAAVVAAALNADIRCLVVDGVFSTDLSIDELLKRWVQLFARVDLARADRRIHIYPLFRALMMFYVELKGRCRFPSARRALSRLGSVPVLFIHGERDTYIRPEWTRILFGLKPGPKDLWICPGAKHNQAVTVDPAGYARRTVDFFSRHLVAQAAEAPPLPAAEPGAAT